MSPKANPWLQKSIHNLVPLSRSDDFKVACKEWSFTGEVIDHGGASEQCELCEHDELRYHFCIANQLNLKKLWVGSSCILRFEDIIVLDEEQRILTDKKERKRALDRALKAKQIDLALEPIRELWRQEREQRYRIEYIAASIKSGEAPQPEELLYLFTLMAKNSIVFEPSRYSVNLRSTYSHYQLLSMKRASQELLWLSMSAPQRKAFKGRMLIGS